MPLILIADDDAAIRATLRFLLENEGYPVIEASDGTAALAALRASLKPLIMLIDLNMPAMNGLEVLRTLQTEAPVTIAHRIMLLTARHTPLPPVDAALLHQLHVTTLHKPFELDELLGKVADMARALA